MRLFTSGYEQALTSLNGGGGERGAGTGGGVVDRHTAPDLPDLVFRKMCKRARACTTQQRRKTVPRNLYVGDGPVDNVDP